MSERDMPVREYFNSRRGGSDLERDNLLTRIGGQLERGGVRTMSQLCCMTAGQIAQVRNIGEKSLAVILDERERYHGAGNTDRGNDNKEERV
jgi:DNA-directed RNA polymerase alpha subunit